MIRVLYIHGLFGENVSIQRDFTQTSSTPQFKLEIFSPYNLTSLKKLNLDSNTTIVAYSLGARVLLKLMLQEGFPKQIRHLHILSASLEISNKSRAQRVVWEDFLISKMKNSTPEEFNLFWNNLSLFKKDSDISIDCSKMPDYLSVFRRHRLSEQPSFVNFIQQNKDSITLHYGEFDAKLAYVYEKFSNSKVHRDCSHRGVLHRLGDILEFV